MYDIRTAVSEVRSTVRDLLGLNPNTDSPVPTPTRPAHDYLDAVPREGAVNMGNWFVFYVPETRNIYAKDGKRYKPIHNDLTGAITNDQINSLERTTRKAPEVPMNIGTLATAGA